MSDCLKEGTPRNKISSSLLLGEEMESETPEVELVSWGKIYKIRLGVSCWVFLFLFPGWMH